jgi:hypothetical protein
MKPPARLTRRVALALSACTLAAARAHAYSIPPGGTVVFRDADQAGLCDLAPRKIVNAQHGAIFVDGTLAPRVGGTVATTRSAIAAGAVEYRHDGSLLGDVLNFTDDCFGITRMRIDVVPPVCGNGVVDGGEQCDPSIAGGDVCCGTDCRVLVAATATSVVCRLRALVVWLEASSIRPAIRRTLVSSLQRVLFRVQSVANEPGRRRTAFFRSAARRLGSFGARVRSFAGRQAITLPERDFLLGASEPMRTDLATMNDAP